MFPDNSLSVEPVAGAFLTPLRTKDEIDFEFGGIGLNTISSSRYLWKSLFNDRKLIVSNGVNTETVLSDIDLTYHSFAFNQNMQINLVYKTVQDTYLQYYDTAVGSVVTRAIGPDIEYPQISLDDYREGHLSDSDVILSYFKGGSLYYRLQRERFQIEHLLITVPNHRLTQIGMTNNTRFRWRYVRKKQGE